MERDYRAAARVFKALCDPKRLAILEELRGGEKCACGSRIVVRKDGMIAVNKDIAISLKYSSILSKLDLIDYGIIRLFPSQDRFQ